MENQIPTNPETAAPDKRKAGEVIRDYIVLFLGAGTIIFLDTWTKTLVNKYIPVGGAWLPEKMSQFLRYFRVTHLHNKGTAFSMFADTDQINIIIGILAALVSLVIIIIFPRIDQKDRALRIAILLQLGGTIGNLISRVQYGYVLDFISVGSFAVFNIADSSLVTGAALMILAVLVEEIKEVQHRREAAQNSIDQEENGQPDIPPAD
ncbi:MAG: signal peptidase II [Anaerolineales bacterium]|nr:signal peptidase II [Anaerolineales bacterium]